MELLKKTAALRIEQQTLNIPQEDVTNISLSDVPLLPERIACFTALSHLTLVSMKPKLKTLLAIPLDTLKSLRMLDVSDNNITVSADETLPVYPTMRKLFIANNKINQWSEMERLATAFPNVEVLDAANNNAYDCSRRAEVFELFPKLSVLDSMSKDGREVAVLDTDEDSSDEEDGDDDDDESFQSFVIGEECEDDGSESDSEDDDEPPSKVVRTE
ncbi:hypothetical protein, conserved [Trypanosoma brucei gambiense DAL972]|uniref:Uncharacterized protein n=1 Tax=Trypanosoma brucei gambiense (strain MHOM/CI/86/DAL972) TaxID=679716 RepID=C9ZNR0_TRYB9|nr:hypothetical protein, conserved [Trypanosoma brucei gambiense DAL972]CBH11038.1 hypothetical protein, conserved [Trypanosoma brucei gambiense DAL972]|eukprot:XP_011773325.1 hypothetical protein, conserved [Trypanosoma brucei gambiense DAL972]